MIQQRSAYLADAQEVVEAGLTMARETGSPSNLAVVGAGGYLLAFARMDGA